MTQKVIDLGKKDAEAVLNLGPGVAFRRFLNGLDSKEESSTTELI